MSSGASELLLYNQWKELFQRMHLTSSPLKLPISSSKRALQNDVKSPVKTIEDVSENHMESRRFKTHLLAIKLLIENQMNNKVTSLRELFYKDVSSFQNKQSLLNEALHNVSSIHGVSISEDCGVYPSSKGLLYGGPNIQINDAKASLELNLDYTSNEQLVPFAREGLQVYPEPSIVVIFEKDSVFKSYCDHVRRTKKDINQRYIMLTAKGFPDRCSTRFLSQIAMSCKKSSIFAFMDSDVYGISIFLTYKKALEQFANRLYYKGVYLLDYKSGWVTVSRRDMKLTVSTLQKLLHDMTGPIWRRTYNFSRMKQELTRGLLLFKKAEMNTFGTSHDHNHDLFTYFDRAIQNTC